MNNESYSETLHNKFMLLNQYRIESLLGQGGFGITYLARDIRLDQQVALKEFLPSQLAIRDQGNSVRPKSSLDKDSYEKFRQSFLDEARTLARFKHPSMVRIQNYFEANNTAYIVMEYEEGQSLGAVIKKNGPMNQQQVIDLLVPLLNGLEVLHASGIVHRDIKPDNIFIRTDGSPVLLDFGAARCALGGKTNTLTTLLTPGYAPMEQYYAEAKRQGPWSDIYALGAVVYLIITGKKPMESSLRAEVTLNGESDPIIPATQAGKDRFSPEFLTAIDWALKLSSKDRPKNAHDWREALLAVGSGKAIVQVNMPIPSVSTANDQTQVHLSTGSETISGEFIASAPTQIQPKKASKIIPAIFAGLLVLLMIGGGSYFVYTQQTDSPPSPVVKADNTMPMPAITTTENADSSNVATDTETNGGRTRHMPTPSLRTRHTDIPPPPMPHAPSAEHNKLQRQTDDAQRGDPIAQLILGLKFFKGQDVEKNLEQAAHWLRQSASQNNQLAQYNLAMLFDQGHGMPKDHAMAAKWYQRAAEQGHKMSQYNLATQFENGIGVIQNFGQALHWYQLAARKGHKAAQLKLATMYEYGRGTTADLEQAKMWYQKAADLGSKRAQKKLESLQAGVIKE